MDSVARRYSMLEPELLQTTAPTVVDLSDGETSEFVELSTDLFTDMSETSESSESVEVEDIPKRASSGTMSRSTASSSTPPFLRFRKQHASSESFEQELDESQLGMVNIQTQSNIEARGVKMRPRLENAEELPSYPLLKRRTELEEVHVSENVEDVKDTRAISSDTVETEDSVYSSVDSAEEAPSLEVSVGSFRALPGRSRSWVSDDAHGE
ncbi:hypothetical protein HDU81_008378 [Chytriomyces hyalinus]|nr:hypothetical protein HDU81_008378 [Chytriomyces hyalinus]